jgi:hypothetical protein
MVERESLIRMVIEYAPPFIQTDEIEHISSHMIQRRETNTTSTKPNASTKSHRIDYEDMILRVH